MKMLPLLTLFLVLCACSNKNSVVPASFKVRLGSAVTLDQVQGGITFGTFTAAGDPFFNDLSLTDFSAEVPQGLSTLYMVAYSGPTAWQGTKYCGFVPLDVGEEEINLSIVLKTSNCPNATEYQTVMNTKIDNTKTFDSATFDAGTFGP